MSLLRLLRHNCSLRQWKVNRLISRQRERFYKKTNRCIEDNVGDYARFTFACSPGVDRWWSGRLAFTRVTPVVSKHLLKCHWARHWLFTSSGLLRHIRARPLTSLCQRRRGFPPLWDSHRIVVFLFFSLIFIIRCKLLLQPLHCGHVSPLLLGHFPMYPLSDIVIF